MQRDTLIGIGAALSANVIFGLNIPVTKALVAHWMTPMGYTSTRMVFGTLVFWGIAVIGRAEAVSRRDFLVVVVGGLLGYLGTQYMFSQSIEHTTPIIFALLISLTPVVTLVISFVFLHETITTRKCIGIIFSVSGAFLVILEGGRGGAGVSDVLGILFAFLCIVFYASYMVVTRTVATRYTPVTIAKWMFLVSALVLLPAMPSTFSAQVLFTREVTVSSLGLLGFALIFSTILAFFCMPLALKKLEAGTVSIFMNLQPLVASVVAVAAGQDSFTLRKGVAALLVLLGVYLVTSPGGASSMRSSVVSEV